MSVLYANKIPHPANFVFGGKKDPLTITSLGSDVYRLRSRRGAAWRNPSQAVLARRVPGNDACAATQLRDGTLLVRDGAGEVVLSGKRGATFGRSGDAWLLQFQLERGMQFYGLGEHSRGLEKSGQRVKFWNTDAIGDYYFDQIRVDHAIPMYVAVPWVVIKQGNRYVGLLVNHPGEVFMDLASNFIWASGNSSDAERRSFYLGAPDGQPDVYLIVGPDLASLTRKLQVLVGRTPLPPLWSLGYHQSRWGYAGPRDLNWLDRELRRRGFPCDGLWLDIDYMEHYKVFTFSPRHWGGPGKTKRSLADLRRRGRRVIAILDPGVKQEKGYAACDDGLKRGVFCQNPAGEPFVGFAWPGHMYLPDYSRADAREWWAKQVTAFARSGMAAAWIDMNDPAIGAVLPEAMLFNRGREPHASYHNQYALGMAQATRDGFLAARPNERPFLLSRSAFISSSRYTAVWTGDNFSNWHHLKNSIATVLGLGLSGLPFVGADVGGFALNSTRDLMIAWYKAAFLLPFFRNHCAAAQFVRGQEPWAFGKSAERVLARYVRLRYKFLPFLYQLFIDQEATGAAILRPLFHDFADRPSLPLGQIDDQFLVGAALLGAPIVEENKTERTLALPGGVRWYSLAEGRWLDGGARLAVSSNEDSTPLFAREGTIVPLRPGQGAESETDLRTVELHVFLTINSRREAVLEYSADDGESFNYQKGKRTTARFRARVERDGILSVSAEKLASGYGKLRVQIISYGPEQMRWSPISERAGSKATTKPESHAAQPARSAGSTLKLFTWQATGVKLRVHASAWIEL